MKKYSHSLLSLAAVLAPLYLSSCGGSEQSVLSPEQSVSSIRLEQLAEAATLASQATDSAAHWLTPELLLLPKNEDNLVYQLIKADGAVIDATMLLATTLPEAIQKQFPHLADFKAYQVGLSANEAKSWLKQQLMVLALDTAQQVQHVSFVQTGAIIDALYTQGDNDANEVQALGATLTAQQTQFKLWAPTAKQVEVHLFDKNAVEANEQDIAAIEILPLVEDESTGVWQVTVPKVLDGSYYQYKITVYHPISKQVEELITTDPYSLSLSMNSHYTQIVDLAAENTQPSGWKSHQVPEVNNVEDHVLYETHIRDFSSIDSKLSDSRFRGKYKAFSEQDSYGIQHLKSLQKAGLNTVHLLPTYDIGTVNEDKSKAIDLYDNMAKVCDIAPHAFVCQDNSKVMVKPEQTLYSVLSGFEPSGSQAQQLVSELREYDNYNWGYDPYHYTVPEGSYALNPQGKARIIEFREMVQSLHGLGFRVIMDVVYNHTYESGLEDKSVLDKIVPNYYHRLNSISGAIEQSTCCDNTATERAMMAKLMTDSLVVWARDYKIDGFRFDLMGHQPKQAMLEAREAVRTVDSDTYFYGEGWNFGEVAHNRQFTQASQLELGGTEIGTFTDRLRDAVRGSGNNTRSGQGVGNGLLTLPNNQQSSSKDLSDYHLKMAQLRIGLAGNLAEFALINEHGQHVQGKDVPYGDQPTGYALDPADTINYVSKHDNQTLWDNSQYRLPFELSTNDRVRLHLQSISFAMYAQGIPFLHLGAEFLRSKSYLRDSYDYGDWFNRVDFSKQSNFYHVGLPPEAKDKENWPLIKEVMAGHQGRDQVSSKHITFSSDVFTQMLAIRMSSPLFRLPTAKEVLEKVSFLNTGENAQTGLIVMELNDQVGQQVDQNYQSVLVIFNTSAQSQKFAGTTAQGLNFAGYQLHKEQAAGADDVVKQSVVNAKSIIVPALTTAVFVRAKESS
ncbi:pullulanase-type alpha-1,6-glucosidase [Litorilituus lipolyticus]|uniref:Pullulanase-type alpha-1,6-glucosidase n=1 Tax=Litorilituus lipolyticus TaxID=2491017 RepID=A0A502KTQ0_9GAMM|nr:pullulanase-type alpha-1,6-glucosidase [Litorilituus lipolyticus]TPH15070.1 pullulanase-type alpha-1,6-glucosidase [Litorilituus lipolyticus]